MVNVFDRVLTVNQVVKETLRVSADGSVEFRARRGKGSGKPITIPADQFDQFISMMNETAMKREEKAAEARQQAAASPVEEPEAAESE